MSETTAMILAFAVYGGMAILVLRWWWRSGRKISGYTSVRMRKGSYSSDEVCYSYVVEGDADKLFKAHQSGNRGPIPLQLRRGLASVNVGEFIVVELGT